MAFVPNAGALRIASVMRTELALAEVRLYDFGAVVPGPTTTLADLDAAECTFTGYAAQVITTWQAPGLYPAGGASIQASVQFATAAPYTVGGVVGGFYVVDVTGTDEVLAIQEFPSPGIPMGSAGQIIPITILLPWGTPL